MTPMKEDYLKIIFELGGASKLVSNKQIALSLDIAAGSVTEMVNKMVEEKLVTHKPYSGVQLTKKAPDTLRNWSESTEFGNVFCFTH